MFIKGNEMFGTINQVTPAPPGWNAVFALHDFSDYLILPVVAWAYGDADSSASDDNSPMYGGIVYAFAFGGEMLLAPASDYFVCYLTDAQTKSKKWLERIKSRLARMKESVPEVHSERKADEIPEDDRRAQRLRWIEECPVEIDLDM